MPESFSMWEEIEEMTGKSLLKYVFICLFIYIYLYFCIIFFVCMCLYTVHFTSGSDPRSHEATINGVAKKAEKFFWTFFATALHVVTS